MYNNLNFVIVKVRSSLRAPAFLRMMPEIYNLKANKRLKAGICSLFELLA